MSEKQPPTLSLIESTSQPTILQTIEEKLTI